ncbi:MAG: hypothetical protein J6L24_07360 [Oscillospiraceae bacterium]|nr:hypothetical protein [Oscillospiraceae bacterium]
MHEYTRRKTVALLLVISLLLPLMPTAVSADTSETAEANNAEPGSQLTAESVSENAEDAYIAGESETELPQSEIPAIVNIETARSREHISRVYSQEQDDLNKLVFQNADGTQTVYLYDFPVKYEDAGGEIRDISLEIADVLHCV